MFAVVMFLFIVTAGCGDVQTGQDVGSEVTAPQTPSDSYVAGLEKVGTGETLRVQLTQSDPIPKYTGYYTWKITILDNLGQPIEGAEVGAVPTMPDHGHGTYPPLTTATENGEGVYTLTDMDLFMSGVWVVTIRVKTAEGTEDEVEYAFLLDG